MANVEFRVVVARADERAGAGFVGQCGAPLDPADGELGAALTLRGRCAREEGPRDALAGTAAADARIVTGSESSGRKRLRVDAAHGAQPLWDARGFTARGRVIGTSAAPAVGAELPLVHQPIARDGRVADGLAR